MAPILAIVYFDGDYTRDDCGENFESRNFVSMKFIRRIVIAALFSKIKRLVPSGNTKTLKTLYYIFQTSMVLVSYATMTIQTQEDVEAMVDTHHGNGADICELYADFQISSSEKDSYQDFSFPPYSATPYDNFGFSSFSNPSFQHFEHSSSSSQPPRHSSSNFLDLQIASFDLNIPPYDNRQDFSGQTTFQSDPTLTLDDQGYSSPEEPIQELGPDGSEIGLFTTPIDADADVDSASSNEDDNPQQEQHHASTSIAQQPYQPPSHMYNIDMDALHVPEFQDMPNLGFTGSYVGLNYSELWIGMQFESIDQAKTAIKLYNIRKSLHSKAIRKLHGDWDASYNDLPAWINIMQKYNPGTIADLETLPSYMNDRVVQEVRQFHRLFWTFPWCINAFKSCKPIIQVDGTFLYGRYKQVLLLAVVQDGNQKTIPIAFALVPREDTDSCKFFLKKVRQYFFRNKRVCLISDRGHGLLSAIKILGSRFRSPNVEHHFCLRHVASNYHGRYKKDSERKLILRMGYELLPNKFEDMLEELKGKNNEGYNYIMGIPKEKWTNAYDGGFRYGHMTTNLAEAINSSLKGISNLPITVIVKATYFRLGKLFATLGKESFNLRDAGHIFHPRFQKELQPMVNKSNGLYVLPMSRSDTVFRVTEIPRPLQGYDPTSYHVNLEEKWCDCGYFQALKSPCQHAIAACNNCRRDYKSLVDPVYFLHSVCKVYEMEFPAIGSKTEWHSNQTWPTILPDHQVRRDKSGRPNSTRIHNAMDMPQRERTGQPKFCGHCRRPGHTIRKRPSRTQHPHDP
ncbi:hypothetical protein GQ457_02G033450 [Hibiscus cannabinus]